MKSALVDCLRYLRREKKYWLVPMFVLMLIFFVLVWLGTGSALVGITYPFF